MSSYNIYSYAIHFLIELNINVSDRIYFNYNRNEQIDVRIKHCSFLTMKFNYNCINKFHSKKTRVQASCVENKINSFINENLITDNKPKSNDIASSEILKM